MDCLLLEFLCIKTTEIQTFFSFLSLVEIIGRGLMQIKNPQKESKTTMTSILIHIVAYVV